MTDDFRTALFQTQGEKTNEELIGVLTAISVVSKRLARKLALLEQRTSEKEGVRTNGKTAAVSANAT